MDDFALRRSDSYGTILINLETRRPLDLLPDRTAEAVKPWLASHREIQVVSRDRASAKALAVSQVLPHATQVADRYHLVQNLRQHLQRLLDRKRSYLPFVEDTAVTSLPTSAKEQADSPADRASGANVDPPPGLLPSEQQGGQICAETVLSGLTSAERKKKISRDKRVSRYEEVMALHRDGVPQRVIARALHLSRNTVRRYVCSPAFPERAIGSVGGTARKSKLDPYLSYLREAWDAGIHNCSRLFHLVKERGYTGCEFLLRMRLSEWRAELPKQRWIGNPPKPRLFAQSRQRRLSSRSASFLMILPLEKLTAKQKQQIEHICQASPDLCVAYHLSQDFVALLKERQAESLDF